MKQDRYIKARIRVGFDTYEYKEVKVSKIYPEYKVAIVKDTNCFCQWGYRIIDLKTGIWCGAKRFRTLKECEIFFRDGGIFFLDWLERVESARSSEAYKNLPEVNKL